jgi:hypothetical protein
VLLSQPDVGHVGALPYLMAKAGLAAPVYATSPIARLGPLAMYDLHTSKHVSRVFEDVCLVGHSVCVAAVVAVCASVCLCVCPVCLRGVACCAVGGSVVVRMRPGSCT